MSEQIGKVSYDVDMNLSKWQSDLKRGEAGSVATFKKVAGAIAGVTAALSAMAGGIRLANKALEAYKVQTQAIGQIEARLKSTGGAAGITSTELQKMASSLQKVTNFGDETTLQLQSMLLTFTKIKGDVFEQAVTTAQDMATAMAAANGGAVDLKSTALQLGRALNDPIKGVTALTRAGVALNENQIALIKTYQESGQMAKAQGVILDELKTEFSGSARAARDADDGAIALRNSWGDLMETMGKSISKTLEPVNEELRKTVEQLDRIIKPSNVKVRTITQVRKELSIATGRLNPEIGTMANISGYTPSQEELKDKQAALQKELLLMKSQRVVALDLLATSKQSIADIKAGRVLAGNISSVKMYATQLSTYLNQGLITQEQMTDALGEYASKWGIVSAKTPQVKAKVDTSKADDAAVKSAQDLEIKLRAIRTATWDDLIAFEKEGDKIRSEFVMAQRERQINEAQRLADELEKLKVHSVSFGDIGVDMGLSAIDALSNSISDLVGHAGSFDEVANRFGDMLTKMAADLLAKAAIFQLINWLLPGSGFATQLGLNFGFLSRSEHGNVFSDGNIKEYAHGGVVNSPTLFDTGSGMGVMGERGAEGVLPLRRNADGDLGVISSQAPIHTHVYLDGHEIARAVSASSRLDARRGL